MSKYFLILCCVAASAYAEPVCKKCEIIREHNAQQTFNYEYYEDYLKDHPNGAAKAPEAPSEDDETEEQ